MRYLFSEQRSVHFLCASFAEFCAFVTENSKKCRITLPLTCLHTGLKLLAFIRNNRRITL